MGSKRDKNGKPSAADRAAARPGEFDGPLVGRFGLVRPLGGARQPLEFGHDRTGLQMRDEPPVPTELVGGPDIEDLAMVAYRVHISEWGRDTFRFLLFVFGLCVVLWPAADVWFGDPGRAVWSAAQAVIGFVVVGCTMLARRALFGRGWWHVGTKQRAVWRRALQASIDRQAGIWRAAAETRPKGGGGAPS